MDPAPEPAPVPPEPWAVAAGPYLPPVAPTPPAAAPPTRGRWVAPFVAGVLVGAVVAGAVVWAVRGGGRDEGWTPVAGFEALPPGLATEPEEAWLARLTPDGGLLLDLAVSRQGAWALTQSQEGIVLSRLDLQTGAPLWEIDIAGDNSIAFELELFGDDDALALSYEPAAGETHIELVRTSDGTSFWEEDSDDALFPVTEGGRQPLFDGLMVFSVGPESVAVDAATGSERWRAPVFPLVREGRLLASMGAQDDQPEIAEVDPETGMLRWRADVELPVVANGVLFLIGDRDVSAVELGSGRALWARPGPGPVAPATGETVVIVRDTEVVGLEPLTGDVVWRRPVDLRRLSNRSANPVVVAGEHLLVVPTHDRLLLLRGEDGSEVGSVTLPEDTRVLAFAEGTMYLATAEEVRAVSLPDLDPLWTAPVDQPVNELLPVDEGLLVGTRDTLSLLAVP
ncbi:MAG: PQQ-binding-like beta-propeller repeat protein [Acidimicrobiales bacterium]